MGLDMYLYKINKKINSNNDFSSLKDKKYIDNQQIGYWRKHADLHQLMEDIYYDRGGEGNFNCTPLILSKDDIEELLEITNGVIRGETKLKKGQGFFWGESSKEKWIETRNIFERVLENTDFNNETVYYDSWW